MQRLTSYFSWAVSAAVALSAAGTATAQFPGPCLESALGTDLALGDDQLSGAQALGFDFPLPGGGTSNTIDVSSNGWVGLVSGEFATSDFSPSESEMTGQGRRIAVMWDDLSPNNAPTGGGVFFNTFPGRAVVTFNEVPEFPTTGSNTLQLQLFADGSFSIHCVNWNEPGGGTTIVGVSPGGGATANSVDISAPQDSGANPALYQVFAAGERDLNGKLYYFEPNGQGGYSVDEVSGCGPVPATADPFGTGCPIPPAFYELNPGGDLAGGVAFTFRPWRDGWFVRQEGRRAGFGGNNLNLGDDALAQDQALGFSFPVPGGTSVTTVDIDSNGRIGLGDLTRSDFSETVAEFLGENTNPILCPCWDDFSPNQGGAVFFDVSPNQAVITWMDVPQFNSGDANTFQVQLNADGTMVWYYEATPTDGLVGFSAGNGTTDPGTMDLSVLQQFTFAAFGDPLTLATNAVSVGELLTLQLTNVPAGAAMGAVNIGYARINISLTAIEAPGCLQLTTLDLSCPVSIGTSDDCLLPIPNDPNLIGLHLFTQAVVLGGGVNGLDVITSNAFDLGIGG